LLELLTKMRNNNGKLKQYTGRLLDIMIARLNKAPMSKRKNHLDSVIVILSYG